ncbi:Tyrosine-protein kinase FRK [Mizuhopecten yessoensis]|uniref:Tyrosine-protein kinase FRK n=1 Tax=Mizuhopecten yessoensis TaxID=6573 RepID=A0A210R2K0_MIZYE|nr:Tyrosine-protein kinase FRK [Mizuhopecten yessoensis]
MGDFDMWSGSGPPLPSRTDLHHSSDHLYLQEDDEMETYEDFSEGEMFHKFFKINEKPEEEGTDSGVYASEDVCKSKLLGDQDLSNIIRCINTAETKTASGMITHVHTHTIPKAVSECDVETLALLLDCDHKAIESRVARVMTELLIQTDMRTHNYEKLLSSLNALFPVLQKRAMCPESTIGIQPVVILVLLVLHHQSLNHPDRKAISDSTRDNLQNYIDIMDTFSTLDSSPTVSNLRQSLRMILTSFQEVLKTTKMSHLQLGNFSEELHDGRHRKRLSKDFLKMSTLEHYSLILGVIVQISKFPGTMDTLDFFCTCVVSVLDFYKKKTNGDKHIYGLLLLTTRAIVSTLEKRHMKQTSDSTRCSLQEKLCEILQMIVCSSKIKSEIRQALQQEVAILMFHETGTIVKKVSEILKKNTSFSLNDTLLRYLTRTLESLSFSSHSTAIENSFLRWQTLQGTIVGHIHVSTQVFLPARESLLNGTFYIDTYRQSASKVPQTAEHYNSLKVLKKLSAYGPNEHVQRLFAFQTEPLPLFYMTETLQETKLSSYLLAHRKDRNWISDKMLGLISLGAVKALRFLHDAGLVHRNIVADSFRCRDQTVVLSEFSIAKTLPRESDELEDHSMQVTVDIPIRWSSYESLCEDEFSHSSDVWMFGQLLYEIFTHGCHPYTDIYGYDLDDVMDIVLFHDLKPKWWPCIPLAIHNVIVECVRASPPERTSLQSAQEDIERWMETTKRNTSHSGNITFTNRGSLYPELNQLQQDKPERGTTMKLRQLKSLDGNVKALYYNTLMKQKVQTNTLKITESDLTAPDHPVIRQEGIYLHIEEPVSQKFIDGPLDRMKADSDFATKQHIVNFPPQKKSLESTVKNGITHTLLYRCFKGKCLLDIALENLFGDPADAENEEAYANIIKEAVSFVSEMHKKKWILRDICCSTLFKSKAKGKVFMPRIGRFLKCRSAVSCVTDTCTNTDDRRNWMPVEVLQHKAYSPASDVYMLAMTVYEFYASASLSKTTPIVNRLEAVPFATLDPKKLLDNLLREEIPNQPTSCPEWIYRLLKPCWNRDPTRRPSAQSLLADVEAMEKFSDDMF